MWECSHVAGMATVKVPVYVCITCITWLTSSDHQHMLSCSHLYPHLYKSSCIITKSFGHLHDILSNDP